MTTDPELAEAFETQRSRLMAMAHRVLGSGSDAEDAVQEAWLRLSREDPAAIANLGGWLTTVVGRICIDMLRSRAARPEVPVDDGIRELVVTEDVDTPEDQAVLADSVGLALLVVLGSLRPDERLAFVLHDMFAVPFAEIADILGRSPDAAKMLASRARHKVQEAPTPTSDRREQRRVVDAFLAASRDGDFDALLHVLDPALTWHRHTARGVLPDAGRDDLLDTIRRGPGSHIRARRVRVNGQPGLLAWGQSGHPFGVMACTVRDGRIVDIVSIVDPVRLAGIDRDVVPPAGW